MALVDKGVKVPDNMGLHHVLEVPRLGGKRAHEDDTRRSVVGAAYTDQSLDKVEKTVLAVGDDSHHKVMAEVVDHSCIVVHHIEVGNQSHGVHMRDNDPYRVLNSYPLYNRLEEDKSEEETLEVHFEVVDS